MKTRNVLLVLLAVILVATFSGCPGSLNFLKSEAFLTLENGYIVKISDSGIENTSIEATHFAVDDSAKLLFTLSGVYNYSSGEFALIRPYSLSFGFIYSGFGIIASVHNNTDDIDFYDYNGNFIKNIKFNGNPAILQNAYGIFLNNNTFLLSEDGYNNVIKVNISEGTTEIFKAFDFGWLGAFTKYEDFYYIYTSDGNSIYKFSASTDPTLIDDSFPTHVTGMVIEEGVLYFVSNSGNGFYSYNLESGELSKIADLDYPKSLYKICY